MSKAREELKKLYDSEYQGWQVIEKTDFDTLNECTEFLLERNFQKVLEVISNYFQDNSVLDIQLVCLYLQAHFNINHSADDFLSVCETIIDVLTKYQFISPAKKKEAILARSINSLFNEANEATNYYYPDFSDKEYQQISDLLAEIVDILKQNLNASELEEFNKVKSNFIRSISKYIKKDTSEKNDSAEDKENNSSHEVKVDSSNNNERYSFKWSNLLLKISKFKELASSTEDAEGKFKLALLFDSIEGEIQSFDPVKYFPREFQAFFNAISSESYIEIQQLIENNKGSSLWNFMLQKVAINIEVDPNNKLSDIGDYNVDDMLGLGNINKNISYDQESDDFNENASRDEDDLGAAFDFFD